MRNPRVKMKVRHRHDLYSLSEEFWLSFCYFEVGIDPVIQSTVPIEMG